MIQKHFLSHIMHGLTHVIPLLCVSGFIMVIRPLFSIDFQTDYMNPIIEFLWMILFPLMSAFIMFSITDRPGIIPGLVIGFLITHFNLGYFSVILFSFIASYLILGLKRLSSKAPLSIKALISTLFVPMIVVTLSFCLIFLWNLLMTRFVTPNIRFTIPYGAIIAFSIVLAAMMSYDFGGPINKIAFLLGVMSLKFNDPSILMSAVMAGGMIAPLGIALSSIITPKLFLDEDKKKAHLNFISGFSFMTEGALPFVKKDLKQRRILFMIASGLAGLCVALFKTKTIFPHGGILVIPFMENWVGFLIAIGVGSIISALAFSFILKSTN